MNDTVKSENVAEYAAEVNSTLSAEEQVVVDRAISIIESKGSREKALTSPQHTRAYLRLKFATELREVFSVLWLDNQHRPVSLDTLFSGTIDGASVYPREVVRSAIKNNAAAAILCHNHPSGRAEPSQADIRITEKIKSALPLIDVRVLDHIIVSTEGTTSFAEKGLI